MRGKDSNELPQFQRRRITPAHAGKRILYGQQFQGLKDHPRPCGEKHIVCTANMCRSGSPPPMRGKDQEVAASGNPAGITPAHAGKRYAACGKCRGCRDHPRPCGEKSMQQHRAMSKTGSPPPMRGKVYIISPLYRPYRITPAHAGKRTRWRAWNTARRDHPRPCGEKLPALSSFSTI